MIKIIYIITFILFPIYFFAQNKTQKELNKNQKKRDSIYFNRFNKGKYEIGGIPVIVLSRGNMGNTDMTGYGLHTEIGKFVKKRTVALFENTTVNYNYQNKITKDKSFYFYSISSFGLRYYLNPKRFTFFGQAFFNYSFNSENTEKINGLEPVKFSRLDFMPGAGAVFSFRKVDLSLEFNYSFPFYYSKNPEKERISYFGTKGLMPVVSLFFLL